MELLEARKFTGPPNISPITIVWAIVRLLFDLGEVKVGFPKIDLGIKTFSLSL